jgi:SAM-dependent methyltransferase
MSAARVALAGDGAGILSARTLANSHPTLLEHLRPGVSVLDVGCGPGTLTAEIARRVRPGAVVGMDTSHAMIRAAEAAVSEPNVAFYVGDITASEWNAEFDLALATRTLQWIRDPARAAARMARAVDVGGRAIVRDYDHRRTSWSDAPAEWQHFHAAFLAWRESLGLDNAIGERAGPLLEAAGLVGVQVTRHVTRVVSGSSAFFRTAGLWRVLADAHGPKMAAAGFATDDECRSAIDAYTRWMQTPDVTYTAYEACAVARRAR